MEVKQKSQRRISQVIVDADQEELYRELDRLVLLADSPDRDRLELLLENLGGTPDKKIVTAFLIRLVINYGAEAPQELGRKLGQCHWCQERAIAERTTCSCMVCWIAKN
ncbi:MAG: hypothetical protein KBB55_02290 [Candidatus Buchananbacteria bacterium]|nr:hypothetical protein [Candidatus Buchananbacteria bacterium]